MVPPDRQADEGSRRMDRELSRVLGRAARGAGGLPVGSSEAQGAAVSGHSPAGAPARTIKLRRTFACPPQEVFDAWTDADALTTWFGGKVGKTLSAALDLQVGGGYRLTMQRGPEVGAVEGVYLEIEPPERLVFTWRWDRPEIEDRRESVVTVEFHDRD